jgi:hypothetical protein
VGNQGFPQTEEKSMNPYVMIDVARQRSAERHEAARKANLVRELRKALRQRDREEALVLMQVPDYVDGTFRRPEDAAPAEHISASH